MFTYVLKKRVHIRVYRETRGSGRESINPAVNENRSEVFKGEG